MYLVSVFIPSGSAVSVVSLASPELEVDQIKLRMLKLPKDWPSCRAVSETVGRGS